MGEVGSKISIFIHQFFEKKKIPLEIDHIFNDWRVFQLLMEKGNEKFDLIVVDKNLISADVFLKIFVPEGHCISPPHFRQQIIIY